MLRPVLAVASAVLVGVLVLAGCAPHAQPPDDDYARDLAAIERERAGEVAPGAVDARLAPGAAIQRAVWLQRRGGLTGNPEDLVEASHLVDDATATGGASDQVALLAALLALDGHRLADARRWLGVVRERDLWLVAATEGDLAVQDGRLDEAAGLYETARAAHPGWEVLARLASLSTLRGDVDGADHLYEQAENDVDAKSMRTYAWLEVQRGRGAFARGQLGDAQLHYDRAGRAYSGYWLVEARRAELQAAQGHGEDALVTYARVAARSSNPEIAQALGELYAYLGRPALAAPWYQKALTAYRRSVERGQVHYLHALAAFHADVSGNAAEAVRWAAADRALRPGVAAVRDQLAWALFRAGRIDDARRESAAALAIGAPEPHALYHAAMVALAAGRSEEGAALLRRVSQLNPVYTTTFHAHH